MRKMKNWLKILTIIPALFLMFSCNPLENDSRSDSVLLILRITGTDVEDNEVDFLQSDVVFLDTNTGAEVVAADAAKATLIAQPMDPEPLLGTSQYNDIIVERYVVTYSRTDGKNNEGTDIPYSFEGAVSVRVQVDTQTDVSFVVVRAVSKLEPPLVNLAKGRAEGELKTTARIDFYGTDTLGNTVKATGYLSIFFANYATDEAAAEGEGGN